MPPALLYVVNGMLRQMVSVNSSSLTAHGD